MNYHARIKKFQDKRTHTSGFSRLPHDRTSFGRGLCGGQARLISFGQARQKEAGQAYLEYIILFTVVTLGVMSFLWVDLTSGKPTGKVATMAQGYFDTKSKAILGN